MGPPIIARVNPSNLYMTILHIFSKARANGVSVAVEARWNMEGSYAGTAGAMLDFSVALGLRSSRSSFSSRVFSPGTILLEVIVFDFVDWRFVKLRVAISRVSRNALVASGLAFTPQKIITLCLRCC